MTNRLVVVFNNHDGEVIGNTHRNFGKFLDPVADKLLVLSTMIMLVFSSQIPAWFAVLVLARELAVDGLRMIAVGKGKVIAAGWLGKIKTTSQMTLIQFLLYLNWN